MDYVVLETATLAELQEKVNEYSEMGWKPQGGVSAVRPRVSGPIFYIQSIYKEDSIPIAPASPLPIKPAKRRRGRPRKNDNGNHAAGDGR